MADHVSPEARSLLAGLLTTDPAARFTVADIYAHPWFVKRCAEPLVPPLSTQPPELAAAVAQVNASRLINCHLTCMRACADLPGARILHDGMQAALTSLWHSSASVPSPVDRLPCPAPDRFRSRSTP